MESPATSKAMVSSAIGNGSSTLPRPSGGHLLVFRLDVRAGADPAHDRHRVQFQIIDDRRDFRRLDQPGVGQDFGNRAGPDAHRRRQTALGLARLLQSPLDHPDIQHGTIFSEFQK
jgi:hypothetical protein